MKKNFFVSTGYFATLSSAVIVDYKKQKKNKATKNYLLIIISKEVTNKEDIKKEIKNQILFAKRVSNWYKIDVIIEEKFPLSTYNKNDYNSEVFNFLFNEDIKNLKFFEVYVSSLNILNKLSKLISFNKANIIDEGIGTYLQIKQAKDLSLFCNFYSLLPKKLVNLIIGNNINNIKNVSLPYGIFYKKLHKLNKIYKTPKIKQSFNVLATSSFYFIKNEKQSLIDTYNNYIKTLKNQEVNLKIKLHPRNDVNDFIYLKDSFLKGNIPLLDMYLIKNKKCIQKVHSMASSILFMAKYVYKIPSAFIDNKLEDEYTSNINNLYKNYIK